MKTYDLAVYINGSQVKDIVGISIKRSSDMKNSKAEITLKNANLKHINKASTDYIQLLGFEMDDDVEIYAAYEAIPDKDAPAMTSAKKVAFLLFNGTITQIDLKAGAKKTPIKLICTDAMLTVMNKVRIANYRNTSLTTVLQNLVEQAFEDKGTYTNYEIPAGLPNITYYSTHKPLHEHILKVSTTDYTGFSRNAQFKLIPDPTNATFPYKFIWAEPKDSASTTLNGAITSSATSIVLTDASAFPSEGSISIGNEVIRYTSKATNTLTVAENGRGFGSTTAASHSSGDSVTSAMNITLGKTGAGISRATSVKAKKSEEDAVNMLIMRLGRDLLNRSITWYAYDVSSETKGLRMKIVDWKHIAEDYKKGLSGGQTAVTTDFTTDTGTIALDDETQLTSGVGYMEVMVDKSPEILKYSRTGATVTIASSTDRGQFNTSTTRNIVAGTIVRDITTLVAKGNTTIRSEIRDLGREQYAPEYFKYQNPRWQVNVVTEGMNINPLSLVNLTAQDIGINNFPLRVKDITHQLDKASWNTTIKLEEDELKVT
jgi:hypothetical protein